MRLLELFSGTGSVGKIARDRGYEVVSLDLKGADINTNILTWNYKVFEPNHFSIIWASPPCETFSILRKSHIGRIYKNGNIYTTESVENDIQNIGIPILRKTEEIIEYFKPKYYFIENPQTGSMKKYIDKPYKDIDYCKYSNWGYRKRTRIWTNLINWKPIELCKQDCINCIDGRHIINFGITKLNGKKTKTKWTTLKERYRIPPNLITEIFDNI